MSLLSEHEKDVFRRLLAALNGAEQEFVIAGGQAARLLRLHPWARSLEWQPLLTSDIDVATIDKGHRATIDLGRRVRHEGFAPHFEGDDRPPRTHYLLGGAEVEFIVPDLARRHARGATVAVLGVNAQRVKNLEPLLIEPIEITVEGVGVLRVPNPAAYVIQKALTLTDRRTLDQKGKDALYVHDALQLFSTQRGLHPGVVDLAATVLSSLGRKQAARLQENTARLGDDRTDFVVEASRQADGRSAPHSAEALALTFRLGFSELLAAGPPPR